MAMDVNSIESAEGRPIKNFIMNAVAIGAKIPASAGKDVTRIDQYLLRF